MLAILNYGRMMRTTFELAPLLTPTGKCLTHDYPPRATGPIHGISFSGIRFQTWNPPPTNLKLGIDEKARLSHLSQQPVCFPLILAEKLGRPFTDVLRQGSKSQNSSHTLLLLLHTGDFEFHF
ncbi:hypothetical protein AVEN_270066-1 [Araneus ventricosus]|uniref:Uncharacterized protein n=1 Tax=Araneus ventricosus TaxID=182803 RepID=A0A4Y2Q0F9_ARAVE|nr:hypothetical protein AVEN_270066-1 [Araneus ventricosus]